MPIVAKMVNGEHGYVLMEVAMRDHTIGQRIMVIGSPGSGKSTFSRRLAAVTNLPLIHLDKEFWNPGWVETPRGAWMKKQEALLAALTWIADGNYDGTLELRLERADTVIYFNLSRWVCIISYLWRVFANWGKIRPDMPEGCVERPDWEFIRYIWSFPQKSGVKIQARLRDCRTKTVIVFRRRRDAKRYLWELEK